MFEFPQHSEPSFQKPLKRKFRAAFAAVGLAALPLLAAGCGDFIDRRGSDSQELALGACRWEKMVDRRTFEAKIKLTYGGPECPATPPADKEIVASTPTHVYAKTGS